MIWGPRPVVVRARPAEARSEEPAAPTFVGEQAPEERNEGGRDAAATGRRPLEVPDGGREKINGLLRSDLVRSTDPRGSRVGKSEPKVPAIKWHIDCKHLTRYAPATSKEGAP